MKIDKGTIREDGMVFWKHGKSYKDNQYWITKEKYEKWKERERLKSLEYSRNNKEKKKEISRKWRENNREKHRAYSINWAKENPDRVNKRNKLWKQKNPERYKEFQKKYNSSVPEKKRKHAATRRCKKKDQSPILTENQKKIIDCFYKQSVRLTERFGFQFEVDHIIPVSRGGTHKPSNLQVLPMKINRVKGCKNIFIWQDYHSPSSSLK